jgi:DNA (cytosine-5)-methyltransferase 1
MSDRTSTLFDHQGGTDAPWYRGRELSDEQRAAFREVSNRSREAKRRALLGEHGQPLHAINVPVLDPSRLMPQAPDVGVSALSLFSGGGGLDLGFARAGYGHVASYDTLEAAGKTLLLNRPDWVVRAGDAGNVRAVDWRPFRGEVDIVHGGPPCQPFSAAGRQRGHEDERNLLPEFVRTVQETRPVAFVAENVAALAGPKFAPYLREAFIGPLERSYHVQMVRLSAHEFGVPQVRHRVFFVGFRTKKAAARFQRPVPTHRADHLLRGPAAQLTRIDAARCDGVRSALGLADIGVDALAPTLRSSLTGPRHTTSILSSASAQRVWESIGVWPNGVAADRAAAQAFPSPNGHFRLSVQDCAVLQGFPSTWRFHGPVYMSLGQIGNSVAPPVAFQIATAVAKALRGRACR